MNLQKKIHISWYIAASSAGLVVGTALALLPQTSMFSMWTWLVFALVSLGLALRKRTKQFLMLAAISGLLIGLWRGSQEQIALEKYTPHYGHSVIVKGKTLEDASPGASKNQHLELGHVQLEGMPLHGHVWVSSNSRLEVKRGDIITIQGVLEEGFGTYAGSMHRAHIASIRRPYPGDIGGRIRDWFAVQVGSVLPEPHASLGVSYTVGQSQNLSESVSDQFRLLGLTHLLVASGSQLTLLVRFARRPLSRRSKYLAILMSLIMIGSFLLLTGFSPSMIRAALVSVLSLVAWYYGRFIHPIVLLFFVAGLTVLFQPSFAWGDVGWLLSFAAFAGIVILAPLLQHYFWGDQHEPGFFRYLLVSTLAAQITTLPIVMYVFGEYSPLALIANIAILPLASIVMFLTFLSGLTAAILPVLGEMISLPNEAVLVYMTHVTEKMSTLPWAHGEVTISSNLLVLGYLAIAGVSFLLWGQTRHSFRTPVNEV